MNARRRPPARLACVLPFVVAGAAGCGESVGYAPVCSHIYLTLEGVIPLSFDEFSAEGRLAAGGLTWCIKTSCTTARVLQPLRPSPGHWDWYEMSSGGRARPIDADSTELYVYTREERSSNFVTVTVTDPHGAVVLESEQTIQIQDDDAYCPPGHVTIEAEPDAGSDAGLDAGPDA